MIKLKPYSALFLMLGGFLLAGMGIYFFFRPSLLPEDSNYIGLSLSTIQNNIPGLSVWLQKVFWVMGCYIFTAGLLTMYVARTSFRIRTGSIYYSSTCRNYLNWGYDNCKFYSSIRFQMGVAYVYSSVASCLNSLFIS